LLAACVGTAEVSSAAAAGRLNAQIALYAPYPRLFHSESVDALTQTRGRPKSVARARFENKFKPIMDAASRFSPASR
jgi:hypothetical protein